MKSVHLGAARLACSLLVLAAADAAADELAFGLRAGGNYSDNVERVAVDETSSSSAIVGLDLNAQREAGRLLYDVFGNVEYQDFFEDDIDAETFGQLYATSSYAFVPERFVWGLSGSFDQTRRDLLRPVAPGNVDDVYTLSTGPQWTMRFGSALESTLEAHYMLADYGEQPFDSDTVGGSLIFGRRQSAQRFIGLGASVDQVSYTSDDTLADDFDRIEYFLRINAQGARTALDMDLGYSEVESDSFDDDGPVFRLHATRTLTPALSAFFDFVQEYPTSGGASFSAESPPQLGTDSSVLTGAPRKSRDSELVLQVRSRRTEALVSYTAREEEELETGAQRDFDVFTASATYSFAPRASLTLYGRLTDEDVVAIQSDETIYGGRINLRLGRLTTVSLRIEQRSRDSDDPLAEFDETAGGLYLRYGSPSGAEGWR